MVSFTYRPLIAVIALVTSIEAFSPGIRPAASNAVSVSQLEMGFFDGISNMFSEEAKKEREEARRKKLEAEEQALREMMERRRNPDKMEEYFDDVQERRRKRKEEDEVFSYQNDVVVDGEKKGDDTA